MANKSFLDQFSSENKPESFQKEVFVPSSNPKKPINITVIIISAVVLVVGIFAVWFFVLRPTIEVPSFIGKEKDDVGVWLRQHGIQNSGVAFDEVYSEDMEANYIIDQSIKEGKKIKKNTIITFTISKGPDPNVSITVPDIISMNLTEINSWIDNNKLSNVKITYEFSDEDPLDAVISYEFGSNASETNFKRSSNLSIVVSKGKQEDQPISVPNFAGKTVTEATNWGSKNKIKIIQKEDYSSTVNKDMIISQSVNPGKKITSKESLIITISKGAPIYAPDFSSYSKENILAWGTKNNVNIEIIERYSKDVAKDKVIEQSHKNKPCNDGMSVTISLGNISRDDFTGKTEEELEKWIQDVNRNGADLKKERIGYKGDDIAKVGEIFELQDFSVGSTIKYYISKGKYIYLNEDKNGKELITDIKEEEARNYCIEKELTCSFGYSNGGIINLVKEIKLKNGSTPQPNSYIYQDEVIYITVSDKSDTTP